MIRWHYSSRDKALIGVLRETSHWVSHCRQGPEWPDRFSLRIEEAVFVQFEVCSCWTCGYGTWGSKYLPMLQRFAELTGCAVWNKEHAEWVVRSRAPRFHSEYWPWPLANFNWNSIWYLARSFVGLVPHPVCEKCNLVTARFSTDRYGRRDSAGVAEQYQRKTHARCRHSILALTDAQEYGLFLTYGRWDYDKQQYNWVKPRIPSWFDWELHQETVRTEEQLRALRENKKLLAKARKVLKGKYEHPATDDHLQDAEAR